jgi:hypothetical protein
MADSGYKTPSNAILVAGTPLKQTLKVETATNMYPGRLIKKGTNDDDIVVCGANEKAIGWLGYEQTTKKYRPATVDTIYAQNDQAVVLNGSGFVIVARLANGQNVVKGEKLAVAANGELTTTEDSYSIDESGSSTHSIERVIAYAEESVDASGGAKDIMVRSLI